MSRESRLINCNIWSTQETITHYEAFGWELLSINGTQVTMSRETQNPVYTDLVKYQAMYEELCAKYAALRAPKMPIAPPKISIKTCFISFVFLVIPCVVYLTYKIMQKKKHEAEMQNYNAEYSRYRAEQTELRKKMDEIVLQSRSVFFAKQN